MQGKVYEIPLDISNGVLTTQIRTLVTEDMGTNTFRIKVVRDNHVPYDFTGTTVRMIVKTPSGARIQQECTIENAESGTVSLTLKQSLILERGSHIAELQIYDTITQSIRLTTPTFTYHVRQSLQNSESIVATDEYTILQEALADLAGINIVVANKADKSDVGDIEDLTTDEKANLVSAINEVKSQSNENATKQEAHELESTSNPAPPHGILSYEGIGGFVQNDIKTISVGINFMLKAPSGTVHKIYDRIKRPESVIVLYFQIYTLSNAFPANYYVDEFYIKINTNAFAVGYGGVRQSTIDWGSLITVDSSGVYIKSPTVNQFYSSRVKYHIIFG